MKEFRDELSKCISEKPYRLIHIGFATNETFNKLKNAKIGIGSPCEDWFPLQDDTCRIIYQGNQVGLIFNKRIALSVMNTRTIANLNSKHNKIKNTIKQITDVLGDVPIVDTLKKQLTDYIDTMNTILKS